jgi:LmbE family N-acetylglucosaminyl deacetylase
VDITAHIELKLQMMACHKSQLPPKPVPGDTLDRMRGIELGTDCAATFPPRLPPGFRPRRQAADLTLEGRFPRSFFVRFSI